MVSSCHPWLQLADSSRASLHTFSHGLSTEWVRQRMPVRSHSYLLVAKRFWTTPSPGCLTQLRWMSVGSHHVARSHWRITRPARVKFRGISHTGSRIAAAAAAGAAGVDVDIRKDSVADDYYSVLGVPHDATASEIKRAYYSCMKACHPDLAGENTEATSFCMFVNEIYEVLSDPIQRMVYDEISGYSLTSINPFLDVTRPYDHVFVDEFSCIGCKNCANIACKTFAIEEEYGRARAVSQCGRTAKVEQAIDTCPVDCIHWVTAPQLSLLEDEMRRIERVNVGVMLSGMGRSSDVFGSANQRWEKKQARAAEAANLRMIKEKKKQRTSQWWQDLWNENFDGSDSQRSAEDKEVGKRAAKAAAAARRWREYSRKGVYRRPVYNLPSCLASDSEED